MWSRGLSIALKITGSKSETRLTFGENEIKGYKYEITQADIVLKVIFSESQVHRCPIAYQYKCHKATCADKRYSPQREWLPDEIHNAYLVIMPVSIELHIKALKAELNL